MENNVKYVCNTPNGVNENNFVRNGSRRRPLCGRSLEGYGTRKRLTYNDDNVDTVRAGKRKKSTVIRNSKEDEDAVRVNKCKKSTGSTNSKEDDINNMRRRICKEGLHLYQTCKNNSDPNLNSLQYEPLLYGCYVDTYLRSFKNDYEYDVTLYYLLYVLLDNASTVWKCIDEYSVLFTKDLVDWIVKELRSKKHSLVAEAFQKLHILVKVYHNRAMIQEIVAFSCANF
eukprot:g2413.t1